LDLFVFHRKAHEVKVKEALLTSLFWIVLALIFNVIIYYWRGEQSAVEFLTGYLIEKSLSVDNLFVFILIFNYFGVAPKYHHKRSEEHTSELQSRENLVCRLLLEKKKHSATAR